MQIHIKIKCNYTCKQLVRKHEQFKALSKRLTLYSHRTTIIQ